MTEEIHITEEVTIDPSEFNKYVARFKISLFGDDAIINLDGATTIFVAKDLQTATYRASYEMMTSCMMEGMPVKSLEFIDIKEYLSGDKPADLFKDEKSEVDHLREEMEDDSWAFKVNSDGDDINPCPEEIAAVDNQLKDYQDTYYPEERKKDSESFNSGCKQDLEI